MSEVMDSRVPQRAARQPRGFASPGAFQSGGLPSPIGTNAVGSDFRPPAVQPGYLVRLGCQTILVWREVFEGAARGPEGEPVDVVSIVLRHEQIGETRLRPEDSYAFGELLTRLSDHPYQDE
jgi:hypothetical protein